MEKKERYKLIKTAGMLYFIPVILVTGPLLGYVTGEFISKKFGLGPWIVIVCIVIGFLSSIMEVIRIIKIVKEYQTKK